MKKRALDFFKASAKWVFFGAALWIGCALMSYGYAWKEFSNSSPGVLVAGGAVIAGRISDIRTSGFGDHKDYFVKVESHPDEIMVPASIIHSLWRKDAGQDVNFGSEVHEGDDVFIRTTGGKLTALEVILRKPMQPEKTILNYNISADRYRQTMLHSHELGSHYLWLGIFALAIGFLALAGVSFSQIQTAVRPGTALVIKQLGKQLNKRFNR